MLKEILIESIESLKKNKLRSALTGFGIAWGIFILTLLLSVSSSFDTGIKKAIGGLNSRDIYYNSGTVTKVDIGSVQGAKIVFDNSLLQRLKKFDNEIENISPIYNYAPKSPLKSKGLFTYQEVNGVTSEYFKIIPKTVLSGRMLNDLDNKQSRKVVMLGSKTAEKLFKAHSNVIGEFIFIDNNWFKVVGIYKSATAFDYSNITEVLVPYQTLNDYLQESTHFSSFRILPKLQTNPLELEKKITAFLAQELHFNKNDKEAIAVINSYEDSQDFRKLFGGLTIFLWFVGISLLTTGVIGISNIMYMTVKERTKEIGIRKALGATPVSIVKMFLIESLLLTNISGFIGFSASYMIMKILNTLVIDKKSIFGEISVGFSNSISIFILLVACGCLAGLFPAKKAADIQPIEAIRYND